MDVAAFRARPAYPAVITAGVASILSLWALYDISGAGVVRWLPLLRPPSCPSRATTSPAGLWGARRFADDPYADELKRRTDSVAVLSLICMSLGFCYTSGAARV